MRLEAIATDRNQPCKYVECARMVLASADGRPVQQVATEVDVSRPMVWRWQQRFAEDGPEGLLRDKTRRPGKPPIPAETVARVVTLTCGRTADRDDALDWPRDGQGRWHLAAVGAAHLGRTEARRRVVDRRKDPIQALGRTQ